MRPTRDTPNANEAITAPRAVMGTEIEMAPDVVPVAVGMVVPPLLEPEEPEEPDLLVAVAVEAIPKSSALLKVVQLEDAGMDGCHGRVEPGVRAEGCDQVVVTPLVTYTPAGS